MVQNLLFNCAKDMTQKNKYIFIYISNEIDHDYITLHAINVYNQSLDTVIKSISSKIVSCSFFEKHGRLCIDFEFVDLYNFKPDVVLLTNALIDV